MRAPTSSASVELDARTLTRLDRGLAASIVAPGADDEAQNIPLGE